MFFNVRRKWTVSEEDIRKIRNSEIDKEDKIKLFWIITKIYYRMPLGTKAYEYLHEIIADEETTHALTQIAMFAAHNHKDSDYQGLFKRLSQDVL